MYKIIVKHSSIHIEGYIMGDSPRLENNFTIYDKFTHTSYFKSIEYNPNTKTLILPRGIDIGYLENLFGVKPVLDTKYDLYDRVDDVKIKYLPRDDVQKEALRFLIGEGEYKNNKYKSQLSLNLSTGKGKSYTSIMSAVYLCIRSAVITSSIDWLNQWKDYILEYTDIKSDEIYFITGGNTIKKLFEKDMSKYKFILISHNTIKSYGDKYNWGKVTELFKYMKIGIKFYDEAHLNFDNMCKIDFYTNTYKTVYVSATPARSSDEENRIYQLYFKNIPSIDLFDEEVDPHTNYIAMKYLSHPSVMEISKCKNMYGLNRVAYTDYIVKKDSYYNMLLIILDFAYKLDGKTLIYIGTNNAIEKTVKLIIDKFPNLATDIGIYTSVIKEDKEAQLDKKIIFSTTKSTGAAIDIKGLKMTVVLAEPFKSEVLAKQTLGRTRADDTFYIEIVDSSFATINKYYYYKKNIFSKYAKSCKEIYISDDDMANKIPNIINTLNSYNRVLFNPLVQYEYRKNLFKPLIRIKD